MIRLLLYAAVVGALIVLSLGNVSAEARAVLWQRGSVRRLLVSAVLVSGLLCGALLWLIAHPMT